MDFFRRASVPNEEQVGEAALAAPATNEPEAIGLGVPPALDAPSSPSSVELIGDAAAAADNGESDIGMKRLETSKNVDRPSESSGGLG